MDLAGCPILLWIHLQVLGLLPCCCRERESHPFPRCRVTAAPIVFLRLRPPLELICSHVLVMQSTRKAHSMSGNSTQCSPSCSFVGLLTSVVQIGLCCFACSMTEFVMVHPMSFPGNRTHSNWRISSWDLNLCLEEASVLMLYACAISSRAFVLLSLPGSWQFAYVSLLFMA